MHALFEAEGFKPDATTYCICIAMCATSNQDYSTASRAQQLYEEMKSSGFFSEKDQVMTYIKGRSDWLMED